MTSGKRKQSKKNELDRAQSSVIYYRAITKSTSSVERFRRQNTKDKTLAFIFTGKKQQQQTNLKYPAQQNRLE